MKLLNHRKPLLMLLIAALPVFRCHGLTFLDAPSFTKSTYAPLAGVLHVRADLESRVSVRVDDGQETWERHFYHYAREHALPLYGFKPDRTNAITVTIHDHQRNRAEFAGPVMFVTDPLPHIFPKLTLLKSEPERMEPGYTLTRLDVQRNEHEWVVILDKNGEVVWFHYTPSAADVRQLGNGNLFMPTATNFLEMNLLAETVNTWTPPTDLPIDPHDGVVTGRGTILYLAHATNTVENYPTSVTNPNSATATAEVTYQKVVELSMENSEVLGIWDPMEVLDPWRISYLIAKIPRGWDAHHANAVIEDPADGGLVVSMRHQHAVIKFDRETGGIVWILGPHENWEPEWQPYLLTPVGIPFEWQYGQHAPVPLGNGRWLVYDNGNDRALPFDPRLPASQNYTRAVVYQVDEEKMEVSQVWQYGGPDAEERLYTPFKGNAAPMPETGNVLIGFSAVAYVNGVRLSDTAANATMVRIQEVTGGAAPEVVFDLAMSVHDKPGSEHTACTIYRALRIPDLYGHPAAPVEDLLAERSEGSVRLQFSADPVRSYTIEASSDLLNWAPLGEAVADGSGPGHFRFEEQLAPEVPPRFYRVATR